MKITLIFALTLILSLSICYAEPTLWTTDSTGTATFDFDPGEIVYIHGTGYLPSEPLSVRIIRPDGSVESCDIDMCDGAYLDGPTSSDTNGEFTFYRYDLDGIEGFYNLTVSDRESSTSINFGDGACDNCHQGNYCDEDSDGYAGWQGWCGLCFLCGVPINDCDDDNPEVNPGVTEEDCTCFDEINNDCDFYTDEYDPGCFCMNGDDDNQNGLIDCADGECSDEAYCTDEDISTMACGLFSCSDEFDNDGDGDVDDDDHGCTEDPTGWTFPESATIGGGSAPPVIQYIWVLPDEDIYTSETQLYPDLSEERNDIYSCVVASDPQGRDDIQNVYVDVYHPQNTEEIIPCVTEDGSVCDQSGYGQPWDHTPQNGLFKYQVHAQKLDPLYDREEIEQCKLLALNAGLITQDDFNAIDYWIFDQPEWYMYRVNLPMLYHQPAGDYEARSWATDTSSSVSDPLSRYFTWISTVAIEIDFYDGIDYGTLQPSVYKIIQGNYAMQDGDNQPTIKNEGNEPVSLRIESTNLTGEQFQKVIDDFNVKWDPEERGSGYGQTYFGSGQEVELADPLELCQTEKIDFSVHADVGLPADAYSGTLTIRALAAGLPP